MNRCFPRAEDLEQEEIDYELDIRSQPEEVFKLDLKGKQRHLRQLFKSDQKEGRNYRSTFKIQDEADLIFEKIGWLESELRKKVEPKHESRVIHYYYRVKRCVASSEDEKRLRRELSRRIENTMQEYKFGPSVSPYKDQINNIIQNLRGTVGAAKSMAKQTSLPDVPRNEQWEFPPDPSTGVIPKASRVNVPGTSDERDRRVRNHGDTIEVSRTEWEDMKRLMSELMGARDNGKNTSGTGNLERADVADCPDNRRRHRAATNRRLTINSDGQSNSESGEEEPRVPRHRGNDYGGEQYEDRRDSYDDSLSSYDNGSLRHHRRRNAHHHRRYNGQGRVEKWKLRFSGDPRGTSVENFLFKATKLAEREGISKQELLRDIHILLEGAASDWFFTYVDGLLTWEDFQSGITYRFGNPNKDQGIRSKIQERKQQRGESFIAFVSEIEKLNLMLSQPLSRRRKFEVIWDNMRQHYRSKISIVRVKDLNHLIDLNYRIDAADHHLHQQTTEALLRRPINQIDAEDEASDEEAEQSTGVNMIRRDQTRNRPQMNRSNTEAVHQNTSSRQREEAERVSTRLNCWNCQEVGHGWRQCPRPRNIFCYGCGNMGRTIRSCERCTRSSNSQENAQQGN